MKKEDVKRMLRRDYHQKALNYLAKASGYMPTNLKKVGTINSVSQIVFSNRRDRLARTISTFELFREYGLVELNESEIKVTEKTLEYAKR